MNYLKELQNIVETTGSKHVSQAVKRNKTLYTWLLNNTPNDCSSISERIAIIQGNEYICKEGNRKKFRDGKFIFCGRPKNCPCALESVKEKVTSSKQNMSKSDVEKANKKREETNLKKYGVKHNSEIKEVVEKRKETHLKNHGYTSNLLNPEWVKSVEDKRYKLYGFRNAGQIEEVKKKKKKTLFERYGVDNPNKIHYSELAKKILNSDSEFKKTWNKFNSVIEMSNYLGVSTSTVKNYGRFYLIDDIISEKSYLEFEMKCFLDSLNLVYRKNDRTILKGKEVDFFIPEYSIAIEMNGLYWHNERKLLERGLDPKFYHYNKWKECESLGINLISIFEDDWLYKKQIIHSILRTKFGFLEKGVYARNTFCSRLSFSESKDFLNKHHIQGFSKGMHFGAKHNEELVGLITIGKSRNNKNLEIKRFSTNGKNNPGLFSKLLKFSQQELEFRSIETFSDNKYFTGEMYKKNGFSLVDNKSPSYYYIDNGIQKHASNFTKNNIKKKFPETEKLLNEGSTEKEIMEILKYDRIWDCGKKKWIWTK